MSIRVRRLGPGFRIDLPERSAHVDRDYLHEIGIVLTRDEAFDLLNKLRCTLADDTPAGKASQHKGVSK